MSNEQKRKVIIVVTIVLALVILITGITLAFRSGKSNKGKKVIDDELYKNNYTIVNGEKYADATVITNNTLKKDHCLEDICIRNLTIYQATDYNNVEMTVVNNGKGTATGSLALVFGDRVLVISYNSLDGGKSASHRIQLNKRRLTNTDDFIVRKLSKEELARVKR